MTLDLHRGLDARLDLLSPELSHDRYRLVLLGLHGYYAAIEPRLAALATECRAPLAIVARAGLLERDLISLGLSRETIAAQPRCADLPMLREREHLAGCLYVLEGSRLGGRLIARAIELHLALSSADGCSFFAGADAPANQRWTELLSWLECLGSDPRIDRRKVVSSAVETFASLERWLAIGGGLL